MKVYAVTSEGLSQGETLLAVFTTQEKAEEYIFLIIPHAAIYTILEIEVDQPGLAFQRIEV